MKVKARTESEISALNKRALDAEVKTSDAKAAEITATQSERVLRRRFESSQSRLKESQTVHEEQLVDMQVIHPDKYLILSW